MENSDESNLIDPDKIEVYVDASGFVERWLRPPAAPTDVPAAWLPSLLRFAGSEDGLDELWRRETERIVRRANMRRSWPFGFDDFKKERNFLNLARLCWPNHESTIFFGDAKNAIWAVVRACDLTVGLAPTKALTLVEADRPCSARSRCRRQSHRVVPVTDWPKAKVSGW